MISLLLAKSVLPCPGKKYGPLYLLEIRIPVVTDTIVPTSVSKYQIIQAGMKHGERDELLCCWYAHLGGPWRDYQQVQTECASSGFSSADSGYYSDP
jgi:hypothetical protein